MEKGMKKIISQLKTYFAETDKRTFLLSILFISTLIFLNYHFDIEKEIRQLPEVPQYFSWFSIFLISFTWPYLFQIFRHPTSVFNNRNFLFILLAGPAIFAWKISADIHFNFSPEESKNVFWNHIVYWPSKLLIVVSILFLIWKITDRRNPFYGMSTRHFRAKPYLLMLLIMIPLITLAATQPDFLAVYPKFKNIQTSETNLWQLLLFEISYGSDFFSIELFFRGFLILALAKYVGKDAILPMALFYCTIHFGKPVGECISSFFGGLILGVITYHTKTIYGGLMVHLGIAWIMELAGYLGDMFTK